MPQKVSGVLVTRHAGGDAVDVDDVVGELYLEAVVVEAAGVLLGHAGELEIVGGDNARDGQRTDGFCESMLKSSSHRRERRSGTRLCSAYRTGHQGNPHSKSLRRKP